MKSRYPQDMILKLFQRWVSWWRIRGAAQLSGFCYDTSVSIKVKKQSEQRKGNISKRLFADVWGTNFMQRTFAMAEFLSVQAVFPLGFCCATSAPQARTHLTLESEGMEICMWTYVRHTALVWFEKPYPKAPETANFCLRLYKPSNKKNLHRRTAWPKEKNPIHHMSFSIATNASCWV